MPHATRAITHRLLLALVAGALAAGAAVSCGPSLNLSQALKITDVSTGYYDWGVVDGKTKLVPTIEFKLQNLSDRSIANVPLMISFWKTAANDEWDSAQVHGIGSDALAPGATTEPVIVHLGVGYTLEQPSGDLFTHPLFQDTEAKIFAQRSGHWYNLGTYPLAHNIFPHVAAAAGGT